MKNLFIDRTTCSSAVAGGLPRYCKERGLSLTRHAEAVDIDPIAFESTNHRLNIARFSAMLTALAEESNDEAFGLGFGQSIRLGDSGCVGLAMRHAPSAAEMWAFYKKVSDYVVEQTRNTLTVDDKYLVNENAYSPLIENTDVLADAMSTLFIRHLRAHIGQNWMIPRMELQREKPRDTGPWRAVFGNNLSFGAPIARNVILREDLKHGDPNADPRLFEILSQRAFELQDAYRQGQSFLEQVRSHVTRNLQVRRANLPEIASDMAMSERSFQRSLAKSGTDFRSLVMETRIGMVRILLSRPELRISSIAERCGYSTTAALSRAVMRAEGMGPAELRRALSAR